MRCATLCNRAEFLDGQDHVHVLNRKVRGDASEEAILKYVELNKPQGIPPSEFREKNPKLIEMPFNSTMKYQVPISIIIFNYYYSFYNQI